MSYLITLGSRKGDVILDPFCGSGSTGVAAVTLKRQFFGIDLEPEYVDIAKKRIQFARKHSTNFKAAKKKVAKPKGKGLWDAVNEDDDA
jgi:DNA modification methylase